MNKQTVKLVTYLVRVRDIYCGSKGKWEEECVTCDEREANAWFKQWKREYSLENGYSVMKKVLQPGDCFTYSI